MDSVLALNVTYDETTDVLYLSARREPAVRGVEDERGLVWRYGLDGAVIGVTVADFREIWAPGPAELIAVIADRFAISPHQAAGALARAG